MIELVLAQDVMCIFILVKLRSSYQKKKKKNLMLLIKDPKFNFYLHKKSMMMKNHYKVNPIKVK